jgi:glycosyltransferase involved in cell wall biosynthesis
MREQSDRREYSIVVPAYNEEESLDELARRLREVLDHLGGRGEVIFVDDGSSDRSYELMLAARARDDRLRALRLSRNFGHEIATTAGVDVASGDAVVIMDADLQDPPEVVEEMVARWREGVDVVYTIRDDRPERPGSRGRLPSSSTASFTVWPASAYHSTRATSGSSTGARSKRSRRCARAIATSGACSVGSAFARRESTTPVRSASEGRRNIRFASW